MLSRKPIKRDVDRLPECFNRHLEARPYSGCGSTEDGKSSAPCRRCHYRRFGRCVCWGSPSDLYRALLTTPIAPGSCPAGLRIEGFFPNGPDKKAKKHHMLGVAEAYVKDAAGAVFGLVGYAVFPNALDALDAAIPFPFVEGDQCVTLDPE